MRLLDALRPEHVIVPLEADSLRAAVTALIDRLIASGAIPRAERLSKALGEERIRDVVHVGDRVLLPHFRTDAVTKLVVAVGIAAEPLRVRPDQPPEAEQIVVLVLAPPEAPGDYLQVVATLARALRNSTTVDRLLEATGPADVLAIPELNELTVRPQLLVRDVMTQRVYRVQPETPVREVIRLMRRNQVKVLPVVGEKREVLGVVSDRDILRHLMPVVGRIGGGSAVTSSDNEQLYDTPVRDVMTRSVMCVSEEQSLSDVVSTMINKDVERMPVVQAGQLTGFLTRADVVRKLFSA